MKRLFITTLAAVFMTAGCATVDVTKTGKGFHEATQASSVDIWKTLPESKYEELGTVTVTGFKVSETAKMHNAIRAKAAALGANAVVLTEEGIIPGGFNLKKWATGVAISYKH